MATVLNTPSINANELLSPYFKNILHPKLNQLQLTYFENLAGEIQSPLLRLPNEIKLYILSFMEPQAVAKSRLICKAWSKCTQDPKLWKGFLKRVFPHWVVPPERDFREAFITFTTNLTLGRCVPDTLGKHQQWGNNFKVHGNLAFHILKPKEIRAVDIRTGKTAYTIDALSAKFFSIAIDETRGLLYANFASSSGTLANHFFKVWDIKDGKHRDDFMISTDHSISTFAVEGDLLCTGGLGKISVWNLKTLQCEKSVKGPIDTRQRIENPTWSDLDLGRTSSYINRMGPIYASVSCLALHSGNLYAGYCRHGAVEVLNLSTGVFKQLVPLTESPYSRINSLCVIGHILFISIDYDSIGFINLRKGDSDNQGSVRGGLVAKDIWEYVRDGSVVVPHEFEQFQLAVSEEILYSLSTTKLVVKSWDFSKKWR